MGKLSHLIFFIAWKRKHFPIPGWFTSKVTFAAAKPHGWLHFAVGRGEMMPMEAALMATLIGLSCSTVHVLCISLCVGGVSLQQEEEDGMTEGCPSSSNGTGKGFDSSLLLFRSVLPCKLNGTELVFSLSEMRHGYVRNLRSLLSSTGFITYPWKWIYVYWSFEYLLIFLL